MGFLAVRKHHAQGEWQETEEEFRCGSGNRWVGQQDDEGGEESIKLNGAAQAVSLHREGGFIIVSSTPLVKSLLISVPGKCFKTERLCIRPLYFSPADEKESRKASQHPGRLVF